MKSLYYKIKNEIRTFEESCTPISNVAHENGFTIKEPKPNENPNETYECFHAEKTDGKYTIVISIYTRDKYRSFGNDEEPYHNNVALYEDDICIDSTQYTYFQ